MDPGLTLALTIVFCLTIIAVLVIREKRWGILEKMIGGMLDILKPPFVGGHDSEGEQS